MTQHVFALIRHGAYHQRQGVPSALQPHPLTTAGEAQARSCGAALAALLAEGTLHLDPQIHSSCELRAWQTARIAADVLAAAGHDIAGITQTPALSERALGAAANLTLAEIEAVIARDPRFPAPPPGWKSDSAYCLPLQGAESLTMAGERVAGYLRSLTAPQPQAQPQTQTQPRLTLCFGHGASFRHAAYHLGLLPRDQVARISMYHARPLRICYTADGTWSHCGGSWKQRRSFDTPMD